MVSEGLNDYPFEYEPHFNKSLENYNPRNLKLFIYSCYPRFPYTDELQGRYPCYGDDGPCTLCIIGLMARLYQSDEPNPPSPWANCSDVAFLNPRYPDYVEVQYNEKVEHLPNGTVINTIEYLAVEPYFEFGLTTDDTTADTTATIDDTTTIPCNEATTVIFSIKLFVTIFLHVVN